MSCVDMKLIGGYVLLRRFFFMVNAIMIIAAVYIVTATEWNTLIVKQRISMRNSDFESYKFNKQTKEQGKINKLRKNQTKYKSNV